MILRFLRVVVAGLYRKLSQKLVPILVYEVQALLKVCGNIVSLVGSTIYSLNRKVATHLLLGEAVHLN